MFRAARNWHTCPAEKVPLGSQIRVFNGEEAAWATVEDRQARGYSIVFTTEQGDFTFYRRTSMVLKGRA